MVPQRLQPDRSIVQTVEGDAEDAAADFTPSLEAADFTPSFEAADFTPRSEVAPSIPATATTPSQPLSTSVEAIPPSTGNTTEDINELPAYTLSRTANFIWGAEDGESLAQSVNAIYDEVVHWKLNLTSLLQVGWPVSDGMKHVLIFSSNGLKNSTKVNEDFHRKWCIKLAINTTY